MTDLVPAWGQDETIDARCRHNESHMDQAPLIDLSYFTEYYCSTPSDLSNARQGNAMAHAYGVGTVTCNIKRYCIQ